MSDERSPRVPPQGGVPALEDLEDPGLRAVAAYRSWRRWYMAGVRTPEITSLEELLASMREEPGSGTS